MRTIGRKLNQFEIIQNWFNLYECFFFFLISRPFPIPLTNIKLLTKVEINAKMINDMAYIYLCTKFGTNSLDDFREYTFCLETDGRTTDACAMTSLLEQLQCVPRIMCMFSLDAFTCTWDYIRWQLHVFSTFHRSHTEGWGWRVIPPLRSAAMARSCTNLHTQTGFKTLFAG